MKMSLPLHSYWVPTPPGPILVRTRAVRPMAGERWQDDSYTPRPPSGWANTGGPFTTTRRVPAMASRRACGPSAAAFRC
jgi:hypothetical protein